jgi:hypothetical protein
VRNYAGILRGKRGWCTYGTDAGAADADAVDEDTGEVKTTVLISVLVAATPSEVTT